MAAIKVQKRFVVSVPGILIWIQIVFASVVIGLLLWEAARMEHNFITDTYQSYLAPRGEEFTLVVAFLCIIGNLIFLSIFCLNCHTGPCVGCPCFTLAGFYNGLMILAWLAAGGVEVYCAVQFKDQLTFDVLGIKVKIPVDLLEKLFRQRAAAAAFCFANGMTYIVTLQQLKYQ